MKRTTWVMTMSAALAAGCGDNVAHPEASAHAPIPTYHVDGMALLDGPPPIVCDARYTIGTNVYDCVNTQVDGDPNHWKMACPDPLAQMQDTTASTTEVWLDDDGRVTHQLDTYIAGTGWVSDTMFEYDDVGLHKSTQVDGHHNLVSRFEVLDRTATGNPLHTTQELPDSPLAYPGAMPLRGTSSYDQHDRLVEFIDSFNDGNVLWDKSVSYDDAALRRDLTQSWGTYPGNPTVYTGRAYELVDVFGRTIEIANIPDANNSANTHDYTYDDAGRLSRVVYLTRPGNVLVTVDNFYDCQ